MDWQIAAFPLAAAALGIALGWGLARGIAARLAWFFCGLLLAGAVVLVVLGQGRPGMEGLGYVIVAVLMLAPAGLGMALGAVIAAARRRRHEP